MKANSKVGKVVSIQLVDDTTEMMVISQFGKIIRIDTKSVRAAGRSTSGVRLLNLEQADGTMGSVADKVASATVIPPEDPKTNGENGTLVQYANCNYTFKAEAFCRGPCRRLMA